MAIALSEIQLTFGDGSQVVDGQLDQVFPDGKVGDGPVYSFLEVRNTNASLTLSSVVAWLGLDPAGGAFAIALAVTTAQANASTWSYPAASSLTYTSPTTQSGGLALPALAAGTKALLCLRRDLTSATVASPESNRLYIGGTSPL